MKVLYINHVGILGGASRSLFELLSAFPKNSIDSHVICPRGNFAVMIEKLGIPIITSIGMSQFDNTEYSYYHKLRWIIIFREIFLFFCNVFLLYKAKKKWGYFDIIHINEITMIPVVLIAKIIFKNSKIVLHVRSLQKIKRNFRSYFLNQIIKQFVDLLIPIDKNVHNSLPSKLNAKIIRNGLNIDKKSSNKTIIKNLNNNIIIGLVGLMHKSKGCFDFVKAASICKEKGYLIDFVFYGFLKHKKNTIYFKILNFFNLQQDITIEVKKLVKVLNLEKTVKFVEFSENIENIYLEQDILCFPSLLMSPGRPIFEAGFYSIPSIAAISNPFNDTFVNGETGLTVNTSDYRDLAEKIMYLCDYPKIRKSMGKKAFLLSNKNFNAKINAKKLLLEYKKIVPTHK